MPTKRLRRKYKSFHGHSPRYSRGYRFYAPRELVILGEAIAIEYACDKFNGGGDGTMAVYRHEFETPALVCMDERGKKQLYIIGSQVKVTEAGIEN